MHFVGQSGSVRELVRPFWLLLTISAVGLVLLAGLLTHLQNRNSVKASEHLFRTMLSDRAGGLSDLTVEYAYWDSAVENMTETVNLDWIADNFGSYLNETAGVDLIFVVDATNTTTYVSDQGEHSDLDPFTVLSGGLSELVETARQTPGNAPPVPAHGILTTLDAFHLVSAARMTTYSDQQEFGTDYVIVFTQAIDEEFLAEAARGYLLDDLSISSFQRDGLWTASLPVRTVDNSRHGYFTWKPALPGIEMLPFLATGVLIAFAVMALTAFVFVRRIGNASEQMAEAREAAERANEAKSDFLRNVAHELRTPVNAVVGFSEIMQQEMYGPLGDPKYAGYAQDIVRAGKHMSELVNDLLDLARIEAGQMRFENQEVDVNETVRIAIGLVKDLAAAKKVDLEFIEEGRIDTIHSDERAIRQIAINLLTNAIKFTPEKGRVECRTLQQESDGGIMIQIQDSGIGISESDLPRVLEPFGQALDNDGRALDGTGLGLPITKKITEALGGSFKLSSKFKAGTTATVFLPMRSGIRQA